MWELVRTGLRLKADRVAGTHGGSHLSCIVALWLGAQSRRGVVLDRRGLTIIELIAVMVIIGLLATIAVPRLTRVRERAFVASMKRDLRTFAMHQESHYYDRASYTDDVAALRAGGFSLSPDVSISVNEATIMGWSATAEHALIPTQCYLFIGDAAPVGAAVIEGSMECS